MTFRYSYLKCPNGGKIGIPNDGKLASMASKRATKRAHVY